MGFYGLILLLIAVGKYFDRPKKQAAPDATLTTIGVELGSGHQSERLIAAVKDVAAAIRDKKQQEMEDTMNALLDELRRREPR